MGNEVDDREFSAILRRVLKDYIPHQLLKDVDETQSLRYEGIDLVKYYMKNSKNKLRSYGCAQTLMKNLRGFCNFPLRRNRYPVDSDQIGNTTPKNYHTLKGEVLICKQDYVFHLQELFRANKNTYPSEELGRKKLEYVTMLREGLEGFYEFVRIPDGFPFSHLLMKITESIDGKESEASHEYAIKEENGVKISENLVSEYPQIFLPNRETKDKNATAAVRIFETCGGLRFVMESELFNAINLKNPGQKTLECEDKEGYLKTIPMEEVYETYRDNISEIDFIRHSIVRTSHAAVPIPTPSGDHCILASDALLEILRRITSAMNIFQKVTPSTWHLVENYMKIIEKYFPSDMQYLYFINLDLVKKMQMKTDEYWKELDDKPVKLIREVGSFGFNFEDIKKELKYLKLHLVFPDITNHMKQLFTSVFCNKNPNELDTPDLYSAIERCQLNCLFSSFLYLRKFRHYQEFSKPTSCEVCIEIQQRKTERRQAFLRSRPARVKLTERLREKALEAIEEGVEATEDNEGVSGETKSFEPSESQKVMESMGKLASSVEYVHESKLNETVSNDSLEDVEKNKKCPENLSEVVSDRASPPEKKREEDLILNIECLRKTITDVVNKYDFKSKEEFLEVKDFLFEEFHRNLRNMEMDIAEQIDNTSIWFNEKQTSYFIEQLEQRENEIVELQESKMKAKKETELIIQAKDDEIAKLKEEISRMSKEMKQAEKFKKSQNLMMADKKKEVELLALNLSTSSQEIKKLSSELSLQKTKEVQIKRSNEENIEKILSLQHNVVRLEKDGEKYKNDRVQMENRQKQLEFEVKEKDRVITEIQNSTTKQIAEHTRVNKKLQETISIMSTECQEQAEVKHKTIRRLLAQISSLTDPECLENGPCPLRRQLMGLRKIKDSLEVRSPLKLAKDISQRLAYLSTRPEVQEMATYEYQQFEGKHQMLLQEVIGNIQKLKEYGDVMAFPPLPEYPSFSDQFVNEYWNEIEKQKTLTSSESTDSGVLEDSECLICFAEMKDEEQTLQCDHCRKVLHLECASKWLKIHRSCPHCRREQLDPNEFPALGN